MLSRMSTTRIKSSAGKVRNLKCALISMFSTALAGSLLLILVKRIELGQNYVEVIIFIVQLGISSSFVMINVAGLILLSVCHRVKFYSLL